MKRQTKIALAFALLASFGIAFRYWVRHRLESRTSSTTLAITLTDGGGARVLLWAADGEPVRFGRLDLYNQRQGATACPIAPGAIGSWDGIIIARGGVDVPVGVGECPIPYGKYKVWAWRGIEYDLWQGEVDLTAHRGKVPLAIPLARAWTPRGTLAADLHVHAQASNDSSLPNPQRVIAQAAAGIQVIGLSDHNHNGDVDAEITQLGLDDVIASIASNELTSEQLHVNVYPVTGAGPPAEQVVKADAAAIFAIARTMSPAGKPSVVQLNHPRFRFTALYDGTHWDGIAWPPPFPIDFDAVEVLAGYSAFNMTNDRRFDEGTRDYYTFLDHGHPLIPVGNSDTHDLNWVLDGTARTYVFVDSPKFDEGAFIAALRARHTIATTGPWLDVEPAPGTFARGSKVTVDITLSQASFVHVEHITVTVGGPPGGQAKVATIEDVPANAKTHHLHLEVDAGTTDTWIGITADGETPMPKEITGTYQQDRWKRPGVTPFAFVSPILVDADGDGRWKRGDADLAVP